MSFISRMVTDFIESFSDNALGMTKPSFAEKRDMVAEKNKKREAEAHRQINISVAKAAVEVVSGNRGFRKTTNAVFGLRK